MVRNIALDISTDTAVTINTINEKIRIIKSLIPAKYDKRTKRGLLNFVGQFSKNLFGTATVGDLNILKKHIQEIESLDKTTINQVKRQGRELASFMSVTGDRLQNAMAAIHTNREFLTSLESKFNETITVLYKNEQTLANNISALQNNFEILGIALRHIMNYQRHLQTIEQEIHSWIEAVHTLIRGKLPIPLCPPKQLKSVLNDVAFLLAREHPSFSLSNPEPGFYYDLEDLTYTHTDTHIFIGLNIPLTATQGYFTLYSVETLRIPTNATSSNTTEVSGNAPYLGISKDGQHYVELTANFITTCRGNEIKHCPQVRSLRHRSIPSCTSALFFDDADNIVKYCDLLYREADLYEGALDLGDGYFLASGKDSTWSLSRDDKPARPILGCKICIIKIPCGYHLSSTTFQIPARLTGCQPHATNLTYSHPISLAILHTLFPKEAIKVISGQESTRKVHQLTLPDMTIHKDNWDSIAAHEKKLSMDFKVIAKHAKSNAKMFATKADRLSNIITSDEQTLLNDSPTTWLSMASVTSLLSIIAIALSVFTFCRTRQALTLLPGLDAIPLTKANVIITNKTHHFAFEDTLATLAPVVNQVKLQLDADTVILYIVLVCSVASFLYLLVKLAIKLMTCCKMSTCSKENSYVLFELSDGTQSVLLDIMTLANVPNNLFMENNPCCSGMEITSKFHGLRKYLKINWGTCSINQTNGKASVPMPETVRVPFMAGKKLQSILDNQYNAKLFICHNSIMRAMPMKPGSTNGRKDNQPPKSVSFKNPLAMTDAELETLLPQASAGIYPTCPTLAEQNYV